jgi:3-keto-5-aminohexanoate cleavage enzyme
MTIENPLMIAVAPNGARKTKQDHGQLPLSAGELADTAAACLQAGACMIHLHIRDQQLRHSLDPETYKAAIRQIRDRVGSELIIQVTTEAVGIYTPAQQIAAIKAVKPEAVSLAIRELCPTAADEVAAAEFFAWLHRERVSPQYILYSIDDIRHFKNLRARGIIPGNHQSILLVLGRYTSNLQSDPDDLQPLLDELGQHKLWWLCAFGATESDCMFRAAELGGHCRVGFENNLLLRDGSMAPNNEALVRQVVEHAEQLRRPVASADQARQLLSFN